MSVQAHKIVSLLSLLFLAIIAVLLFGTLCYFLFYKMTPIVFDNITPKEGIYERGGVLPLKVEFCRYTTAAITMIRSWTCGNRVHTEKAIYRGGAKEGCQKLNFKVNIPDCKNCSLSVYGNCFIKYKIVYHIGPLLNRVAEFNSGSFYVKK